MMTSLLLRIMLLLVLLEEGRLLLAAAVEFRGNVVLHVNSSEPTLDLRNFSVGGSSTELTIAIDLSPGGATKTVWEKCAREGHNCNRSSEGAIPRTVEFRVPQTRQCGPSSKYYRTSTAATSEISCTREKFQSPPCKGVQGECFIKIARPICPTERETRTVTISSGSFTANSKLMLHFVPNSTSFSPTQLLANSHSTTRCAPPIVRVTVEDLDMQKSFVGVTGTVVLSGNESFLLVQSIGITGADVLKYLNSWKLPYYNPTGSREAVIAFAFISAEVFVVDGARINFQNSTFFTHKNIPWMFLSSSLTVARRNSEFVVEHCVFSVAAFRDIAISVSIHKSRLAVFGRATFAFRSSSLTARAESSAQSFVISDSTVAVGGGPANFDIFRCTLSASSRQSSSRGIRLARSVVLLGSRDSSWSADDEPSDASTLHAAGRSAFRVSQNVISSRGKVASAGILFGVQRGTRAPATKPDRLVVTDYSFLLFEENKITSMVFGSGGNGCGLIMSEYSEFTVKNHSGIIMHGNTITAVSSAHDYSASAMRFSFFDRPMTFTGGSVLLMSKLHATVTALKAAAAAVHFSGKMPSFALEVSQGSAFVASEFNVTVEGSSALIVSKSPWSYGIVHSSGTWHPGLVNLTSLVHCRTQRVSTTGKIINADCEEEVGSLYRLDNSVFSLEGSNAAPSVVGQMPDIRLTGPNSSIVTQNVELHGPANRLGNKNAGPFDSTCNVSVGDPQDENEVLARCYSNPFGPVNKTSTTSAETGCWLLLQPCGAPNCSATVDCFGPNAASVNTVSTGPAASEESEKKDLLISSSSFTDPANVRCECRCLGSNSPSVAANVSHPRAGIGRRCEPWAMHAWPRRSATNTNSTSAVVQPPRNGPPPVHQSTTNSVTASPSKSVLANSPTRATSLSVTVADMSRGRGTTTPPRTESPSFSVLPPNPTKSLSVSPTAHENKAPEEEEEVQRTVVARVEAVVSSSSGAAVTVSLVSGGAADGGAAAAESQALIIAVGTIAQCSPDPTLRAAAAKANRVLAPLRLGSDDDPLAGVFGLLVIFGGVALCHASLPLMALSCADDDDSDDGQGKNKQRLLDVLAKYRYPSLTFAAYNAAFAGLAQLSVISATTDVPFWKGVAVLVVLCVGPVVAMWLLVKTRVARRVEYVVFSSEAYASLKRRPPRLLRIFLPNGYWDDVRPDDDDDDDDEEVDLINQQNDGDDADDENATMLLSRSSRGKKVNGDSRDKKKEKRGKVSRTVGALLSPMKGAGLGSSYAFLVFPHVRLLLVALVGAVPACQIRVALLVGVNAAVALFIAVRRPYRVGLSSAVTAIMAAMTCVCVILLYSGSTQLGLELFSAVATVGLAMSVLSILIAFFVSKPLVKADRKVRAASGSVVDGNGGEGRGVLRYIAPPNSDDFAAGNESAPFSEVEMDQLQQQPPDQRQRPTTSSRDGLAASNSQQEQRGGAGDHRQRVDSKDSRQELEPAAGRRRSSGGPKKGGEKRSDDNRRNSNGRSAGNRRHEGYGVTTNPLSK